MKRENYTTKRENIVDRARAGKIVLIDFLDFILTFPRKRETNWALDFL